jgi:hypothetical protein
MPMNAVLIPNAILGSYSNIHDQYVNFCKFPQNLLMCILLIIDMNFYFQCKGTQSASSIEHMFSWILFFKPRKLNLNVHIKASGEESVRKNASVLISRVNNVNVHTYIP